LVFVAQLKLFKKYKPIGAAPGCDYVVAKRMVRTTINLVLYNIVRYDTSKKGGNDPRGLRIKRARDDYVGYLILRKPHYC